MRFSFEGMILWNHLPSLQMVVDVRPLFSMWPQPIAPFTTMYPNYPYLHRSSTVIDPLSVREGVEPGLNWTFNIHASKIT
jgi:hypothetical protein